ncbi:MAG: glycosyltransferase family 9 protein [Alphaproteobacteria bacterium]|nr:glycosyltransferase family 9 protein [Alphaproteobacteria bacterium]
MPVRSILVYVTSDADNALGENVLKLPLLLALSTSFPSAKISWVPGTSGAFYFRNELAPLVDGRIHEFITNLAIPADPRSSLRAQHPILNRHFDLIIDTQRYVGRTLFLRQISHCHFISGTWRYFFSDACPPRGLSRRPARLTDKLLGLAAAAARQEIPVPNPIPLQPVLRAAAAQLLPAGPTYIALAPGAGVKHTGKCWPLDRFIALARQQVERERLPVFLIGPAERDWLAPLRAAIPQALFPEQRGGDAVESEVQGPSLVAALAERVAVAVANCSGTGHLLAAGGAPMVSLYGPTRPEKYAPFARALICIKAQDFGSERVEAIPLDAVSAAVERQVAIGPALAEVTKGPKRSAPLLAPISAGELLDKITILLIKTERIADPAKRRNVMQELASLTALREQNIALTGEVEALYQELASINRQLWETEDRLRQCERDKRFDDNFIELARSVYQANDRRAAIKRQLNEFTGSALVEEKSYL